jgi:hypothetical protein
MIMDSSVARGGGWIASALVVPLSIAVLMSCAPLGKAAEIDEGPLIARAVRAVERYRLTEIPAPCLSFRVLRNRPQESLVEVREKHDERCGGDPGTSPRLFGVLLDESGVAATDADSDDGTFRRLGPID